MAASDVAVGMVFLFQTVLGILGNSSHLYRHLFLYFTGGRLKPTDFILNHLIVANILTLLCKGIPQTMASLGLEGFLNDIGCKLTVYFHRVGRTVSIGSTCLLSVFQAITISPRDSRWAELKGKAPRYIGSSLYLNWIMCILVNSLILKCITGKWNNRNTTDLKDFGCCSAIRLDKTTDTLFTVWLTFPDVVCVGLMLWASISMVFILHRHKQRMRHIHTTICPRSSPESRATKTILLLVSTFVCFYTLSSIFQVCFTIFYSPNEFLVNIAVLVDGCFPTVSPFLLMSGGSNTPRLCFIFKSNRKTSN